jgi:hypothetical protein
LFRTSSNAGHFGDAKANVDPSWNMNYHTSYVRSRRNPTYTIILNSIVRALRDLRPEIPLDVFVERLDPSSSTFLATRVPTNNITGFRCRLNLKDSPSATVVGNFLRTLVRLRILKIDVSTLDAPEETWSLPALRSRLSLIQHLFLEGYDWPTDIDLFDATWDFSELTHLTLIRSQNDEFFQSVPTTCLQKVEMLELAASSKKNHY